MRSLVEARIDILDRDPDRRLVSDANAHLSGVAALISQNRDAIRNGGRIEPTFLAAQLREDWNSLSSFLDISSVDEIRSLVGNDKLLAQKRVAATRYIEGMFEIPPFTVEGELDRYAHEADETIDDAQADIPESFMNMGSESAVKKIHHPLDLAIAGFTLPMPRDRFRAIRKLLLMQTAAEVDFEERSKQTEAACKKFKGFIEGKVFDTPAASDERYYLRSRHDDSKDSFDTIGEPQIVKESELKSEGINLVEETGLEKGEKLLPLLRRTFTLPTGEVITAYVPEAEKNIGEEESVVSAKSKKRIILKSWRKNMPTAKAVDDQVRIMVLLETKEDLDKLRQHIVRRAALSQSATRFVDVQDTIDGGIRPVTSEGGSPDMEWYRAHLLMFGIRPEFIGHTLTSAADYFHGRNAHRRYELNRTLDSVIPRLIPPKFYGNYDPNEVNSYARKKVEDEIRDPYRLYPFTKDGKKN